MLALSGEQVADRWPIIKTAMKLSAIPTADVTEEKLNNMLKALLCGKAVCWMSGNERKPRTVIVTNIGVEEISLTKNLFVYCAHGFVKERPSQYRGMLESLKNYAINSGCHNIISYIGNNKLVEILRSYGAECNYTLVVFPLR